MKTLLYYSFKLFIKTGLFFYAKKIEVLGEENIPKNEAVLFTANHPNGLIDPLLIATYIKRKTHFLVRAAVFKKQIIAYFFDLLGMMPIYRMRDGIKQLSKNEMIFNKCQQLLRDKKTLLIFPEGSHNKKRTIRPLSKGFTRIIFRTLNEYPNTKIHIVPVGITYQNSSEYPSKVAIHFGKTILANQFYNKEKLNDSVSILKQLVRTQLEDLSVHITNNDNYDKTLSKLLKAQVNFTDVKKINSLIKEGNFPAEKTIKQNKTSLLLYLVIINSLIPYTLWKFLSKKVDEVEFIDTFRFGVNIVLLPLFYAIQSYVVYSFFDWKAATIYFLTSLALVLLHTKTSNL